MNGRVVLKVFGVLLVLFSSTLLPPVAIAWWKQDGAYDAFLIAYVATIGTGLACWFPVRRSSRDLRFRDGFLIVVLFWTVLAVFGAIPLALADRPHMSITDAFFESMSGLTTTGATVLTGIDELPVSVRYYRQQLQWLGGMGIIVLAVAVMPMLGVGGMQLYRAETPGPVKDTKLTPRITQTAKALWYIYLGLTLACALAYWLAGMSVFDAVSHAFSTVAIGGFSTHDSSLGYFDSPVIGMIAIVFMLLSGINFALHFTVWRSRHFAIYLHDTEVRTFLAIVAFSIVLSCGVLLAYQSYGGPAETLWHGAFQVVSVVTTTGFTTDGYAWWPSFLPFMLVILSAVGGCGGSTAGGMKVIRAVLLYKQGRREIAKLVHPNALIPIKLGGRPVPETVIHAVWGFFAMYVLCYVVLSLLMTGTGADAVTAFSSVTATLNNMGPGLGAVADNYADLSDTGKWILCFAMLLGRLELFTLLVLLSRTFWRS